MPQRPLKRSIREHVKDNLCDERWQGRMAASVSRCEEKIRPFPWHDPKKGDYGNPHWLNTPWGMLEEANSTTSAPMRPTPFLGR